MADNASSPRSMAYWERQAQLAEAGMMRAFERALAMQPAGMGQIWALAEQVLAFGGVRDGRDVAMLPSHLQKHAKVSTGGVA